MQLDPDQQSLIQEALDNLEFTVYEQYSGRGMYGSKCFGFYTRESGAELKFAKELVNLANDNDQIETALDLLDYMAQSAASDNLGMDTIYYYKRLQWNEDTEEETEEDDTDDENEG